MCNDRWCVFICKLLLPSPQWYQGTRVISPSTVELCLPTMYLLYTHVRMYVYQRSTILLYIHMYMYRYVCVCVVLFPHAWCTATCSLCSTHAGVVWVSEIRTVSGTHFYSTAAALPPLQVDGCETAPLERERTSQRSPLPRQH